MYIELCFSCSNVLPSHLGILLKMHIYGLPFE